MSVEPARLHLLSGVANLTVGRIDLNVQDPSFDGHVRSRIGPVGRLPDSEVSHGDEMAAAVVASAPDAQLSIANLQFDRGLLTRRAVAAGIRELAERQRLRLINVSLSRVRDGCTVQTPCEICQTVNEMTDRFVCTIVAAAGNRGTQGLTCPGAVASALSVGATEGPSGSDNGLIGERTVTGPPSRRRW